jgi:hypothetical protein
VAKTDAGCFVLTLASDDCAGLPLGEAYEPKLERPLGLDGTLNRAADGGSWRASAMLWQTRRHSVVEVSMTALVFTRARGCFTPPERSCSRHWERRLDMLGACKQDSQAAGRDASPGEIVAVETAATSGCLVLACQTWPWEHDAGGHSTTIALFSRIARERRPAQRLSISVQGEAARAFTA